MVSEADDAAHYYFAEFESYVHEEFGHTATRVALFDGLGEPFDFVDLRDPGSRTGVAFVRSYLHPDLISPLPRAVFYVGQGLDTPLSPTQRAECRRRLGIRGEVVTIKDVLRFMLLTEAGSAGKPGRLQSEPDGGLYVHLGDLTVDLSDTAG